MGTNSPSSHDAPDSSSSCLGGASSSVAPSSGEGLGDNVRGGMRRPLSLRRRALLFGGVLLGLGDRRGELLPSWKSNLLAGE